nr:RNA-directed DNA polymerase, eukaryota [Tanacetum cinerariifolium]
MPRAIIGDTSLTKSYIPKVYKIPGFSPVLAQFYKPIENHCIHEGQVVDQLYYQSNGIKRLFTNIRFNCLFEINEPIVLRFILDFYSHVNVQTDEYGYLLISFMIQHRFITLSLAQFGQILKIPYNSQAVFTNEWDVSSLAFFQDTEGPYHTNLPTPDKIHRFFELERHFPHLDNGIYNVVDRVMHPLALKQIRKPQSDRGMPKARHSVSSSSAHHFGSLSHHGDDDEDDGIFRASTPSPTFFINSFSPLNYQIYHIPTSSQQDEDLLFERQTMLLNQTQQMHEEVKDQILNDGTPRVDIAKNVVSPSVVEETVVKEKLSHVKRHLDVKLLKEDVGNVLVWVKLYGVLVTAFSGDGLSVIATKLGTTLMLHSYTSDMCMQSYGRSSYARAMIELRADVELYWRDEKKTSQTPNGFPVGQKMEFKSTKQVYQPISKKPTANTSVNKKKNVDYAKEVSIQATNSSGSSFWNVDASSPSTTLVIEKIDKIEKLIIEGKVALMDDEDKPFEKSLLEQWTESYENGDYEYDQYDDDMYEGQDIHEKLQAICDILDIAVRGRGRNNNHRKKINTDTCSSLVSYSDRILNDVLGSKQQLPMQDSTSASNAFGKSLYANVTGKSSGTKLNFRTLFTPRAIYGDDGKVGKVTNAGIRSCWMNIVNEISVLKNQGVNFFDFMRLKLGKEDTTLDWWWVWSLESSREFSVASVQKVMDEKRLSNVNTMTRWIICVHIKVNVLAWKIKIDALSTRLNISRRDALALIKTTLYKWFDIEHKLHTIEHIMATKLLLLSILIIKLLIFTDAQSVGVCNGRVGNGLPS